MKTDGQVPDSSRLRTRGQNQWWWRCCWWRFGQRAGCQALERAGPRQPSRGVI